MPCLCACSFFTYRRSSELPNVKRKKRSKEKVFRTSKHIDDETSIYLFAEGVYNNETEKQDFLESKVGTKQKCDRHCDTDECM